MRLPSAYSILLGVVALGACKEGDPSALDTFNTSAETTTDTTVGNEESTESDDESGTETGDPEPQDSMRYLVTADDGSRLLGLTLDDPAAIPDAQSLISGEGVITLFGKTPFDGEIVSHDGRLDQLRVDGNGNYEFSAIAEQAASWLDHIFFGADAANAILAVGPTTPSATNQLLWVTYDDTGAVTSSTDITPPIDANGSVVIPDIGTDNRYAAILVDTELDSTWQLYALNLDPQPNVATYIDQLPLLGLPPTSVSNFVWLDIHPNRISYRKESMPGEFQPFAVALDDPDTNRVNLAPSLSHISSMMWSPDQTRLLVSAAGSPGYRQLWLIDVIGDTDAQTPVKVTEVGNDARVNTSGTIDFATIGHGFDNLGRIWYAYTDSNSPEPISVGVNLVVVVDGMIIQRVDLIEPYPGLEIDEVYFDKNLQRLGFRAQSTSFGGSIRHVDLSQAQYQIVTMEQSFTHDDLLPMDDVDYTWSEDGSRIVMVGVQDGVTTIHVGDMSDPLGASVPIMLPTVETAPGIVIDHKPRVSPDGEHVILWYSAQDGRTGLIHAPLDGSGEGQVVLGLAQSLDAGTFLRHVTEP